MGLTTVILALATAQGGVSWHRTVEEARDAAAREGKLVYILHLVGDLDKEKC